MVSAVVGSKRAAEGEAGEQAPQGGNKPGKKLSKRLRNQTPEQKIEIAFRRRIEECAKPSDAATALGVYAEMKEANVPRQPYLYRVLINICSSCADSSAFRAQAFQVYEDMKQDGHEKAIDESTYSALVKICSKDYDFTASRELIAALEARSVSPKLRTFAPLLAAYSAKGDLENCLWVRERLTAHDIEPTEPDFVALLRACVKTGNATQFYATLDEFIDCVEKPGADGWDVLKEWFASDAAKVDGKAWTCSVGPVDAQGVCSVSGDQLQSIELAPEVDQELLAKIESLVRTDEKRIEQWDAFKAWLEEFGPFEVLIDAANVGYFGQNFDGGGFNYKQIELMLEHYEQQGKRVLIVLHKRRTYEDQVPVEHRYMVQQWAARNVMYNCKSGNNDDWYWLYAAVNAGGRVLMVSNDEMRDHHFQMIHNKAFVRWKERHQVRYAVHCGQRTETFEPTPFSHRPQRVGANWHFPGAHEPQDWLCMQLDQ